MEQSNAVTKDSKPTDSWMRQNVIDVAPLWAEFIQTAFANVRISVNERPWKAGLTPLKPSRHIDAIAALDPAVAAPAAVSNHHA